MLLGDRVHKVLSRLGFKTCRPCDERRLLLNALHLVTLETFFVLSREHEHARREVCAWLDRKHGESIRGRA